MGSTAANADLRYSSRAAFGERAQGRAVVFRDPDGNAQDIDGIYRAASRGVSAILHGGNGDIISTSPTLGALEASWFAAEPGPGCEVDVAGTTFAVVRVDADGEGGLTFTLSEAAP